jgi:hypothetical protein
MTHQHIQVINNNLNKLSNSNFKYTGNHHDAKYLSPTSIIPILVVSILKVSKFTYMMLRKSAMVHPPKSCLDCVQSEISSLPCAPVHHMQHATSLPFLITFSLPYTIPHQPPSQPSHSLSQSAVRRNGFARAS